MFLLSMFRRPLLRRYQYVTIGPKDVAIAAKEGNLPLLKLLQYNGVKIDKRAARYAAESGHLHVLDYLLNVDSLDSWTYVYAVKGDQLMTIKYLLFRGVKCDSNLAAYAAGLGYINLLKLAHDRRLPICEKAFACAASTGQMESLQYLYKIRAPVDAFSSVAAVKHKRLDVIQWLWERKLFWLSSAIEYASHHKDNQMLEFLTRYE